jgi:hypothetical protein
MRRTGTCHPAAAGWCPCTICNTVADINERALSIAKNLRSDMATASYSCCPQEQQCGALRRLSVCSLLKGVGSTHSHTALPCPCPRAIPHPGHFRMQCTQSTHTQCAPGAILPCSPPPCKADGHKGTDTCGRSCGHAAATAPGTRIVSCTRTCTCS